MPISLLLVIEVQAITHIPQKTHLNARFSNFLLVHFKPTNGLTDRRKDGRTDKASYRVACPQQITENCLKSVTPLNSEAELHLWRNFASTALNGIMVNSTQGVFLVKIKNAFVTVKRVYSMNTYSRISTVPRGSERSERASLCTERASKASKRSEQANEQAKQV